MKREIRGGNMDTVGAIKKTLESMADFSHPAQGIEEVMGDMNMLLLLCEKNLRETGHPLFEIIDPDITQASRFLFRLENMILETGGSEKAVAQNMKALVYATLEHLILRVGISATFENPFTLFTNAVSFILNRISEYSYVQSARDIESIYLNKARMYLREDLWETVMTNPEIKKVQPEGARELNRMITVLVNTIDQPRNPAVYVQFYAFLFYVYVLKALESIREYPGAK